MTIECYECGKRSDFSWSTLKKRGWTALRSIKGTRYWRKLCPQCSRVPNKGVE